MSLGAGRLGSSDGLMESRFLPGAMLERRYRIVGLIGWGGMGEVYRADDLKLGQPVALKFLPEELNQNADRLERFLNEVKIARQVSHPNVCRVYDVGDIEGQHYLSMEYVDGEDLASLLRRIGRLPHDKAVEIARQICSGLAAAHARGIAHRDLKPANVMIDGRGHVRITDFGLAGLAEGIQGAEIRAGTPEYMAPEQLAGKEVTLKSDLYALGLVLYELFTGKRAYRADSVAELARMREQTQPPSPSSIVDNLDPVVERVILRCMERNPDKRPASALAVAAALPGGDPLAAALAAGETPSPEMVAEAGDRGGLKPWLAVMLLILALSFIGGAVLLSQGRRLVDRVPLPQPPTALAVEARETLASLGYGGAPVDRAWGFSHDQAYLDKIRDEDDSDRRWDAVATIRPAPILFWYRESPAPLVPSRMLGTVRPTNPPLHISGMSRVTLDGGGRLVALAVVPPQRDEAPDPAAAANWTALFERAGLDPDLLTETVPQWNPLLTCDRRAAWEGTYPGQPDVPIRVEAGAYAGRPVFFQIVAPWTEPARQAGAATERRGVRIAEVASLVLFLALLVGALVLARRNIRFGRIDRRGAFRVALYVFAVTYASWLVTHHPVLGLAEVGLLILATQWALFTAAIAWVIYVALEPYTRRLWPQVLISWTRLLSGRLGDPLVGRDILIGYLAGGVLAVLVVLSSMTPSWIGGPPQQPQTLALTHHTLDGARHGLGMFFDVQTSATFVPLALMFLIVLLRFLLRNRWLAAGGTWLVMTLIGALSAGGGNPFDWLFSALAFGLVIAILLRGGLLATILSHFFSNILLGLPLTLDFTAWYAPWALGVLVLASVLPLYGFYVSMAGKPLFEDVLQEA
jgi:serine/threonine-protein kinase